MAVASLSGSPEEQRLWQAACKTVAVNSADPKKHTWIWPDPTAHKRLVQSKTPHSVQVVVRAQKDHQASWCSYFAFRHPIRSSKAYRMGPCAGHQCIMDAHQMPCGWQQLTKLVASYASAAPARSWSHGTAAFWPSCKAGCMEGPCHGSTMSWWIYACNQCSMILLAWLLVCGVQLTNEHITAATAAGGFLAAKTQMCSKLYMQQNARDDAATRL